MSTPAAVVVAVALAVCLALSGCAGDGDDTVDGPSAGASGPSTSTSTSTSDGGAPSAGAEPDRGCTDGAPAKATVAYEEVAGVDPNLTSIDVYGLGPACPDAPVVFWVHGGGWAIGDKVSEGTATKAAWAAEHGWVLVAVNYRLSSAGAGVRWPTHGDDVAAAVAFTLDRAEELGIDAARVALMGHSAGGHLVSILSVDPDLLAAHGHDRSEVDCLVSLDTEGYDLVDRVGSGGDITIEMVTNAFGSDRAGLADASPLQTLERVGGPVPDAVIVTRGQPRRKAQAEGFAAALRGAGAEVTVVEADGYSHADVNARLGTAGETVETPTITEFLTACLA